MPGPSDPAAIAGHRGSGGVIDRAMCGFAVAYADQKDEDVQPLRPPLRSGRIAAAAGCAGCARQSDVRVCLADGG